MQSDVTTTGSFSEHLACKQRSSGANYARRREAAVRPKQPLATPFSKFLPSLEAIKNITNF